MKKITSMLLAVLILISAFSIQSFAGFFGSSAPKAVSAAMSKESKYRPVTMEMVDSVIDYAKDMDELDELKKVGKCYIDYWFDVDVTFDNGKTVRVGSNDYSVEVDKNYSVSTKCYVNYKEYISAKKKGSEKIKLYIECETSKSGYSILDSVIPPKSDVETFKVTRKLIKGPYVKSVSLLSDIPDLVYACQDVYTFEGSKVKVKYYNGKVKTFTVKKTDDSFFGKIYTIGGSIVNPYVYESSIDFDFLDSFCSKEVKLKKFPFKSIKINDYKFENGNVTSITYTIKKINNTSKTYTCTDTKAMSSYEPILITKGFKVYANVFDDTFFDGTDIEITVSLSGLEDSVSFEKPKSPEPEKNSFLGKIQSVFETIISYVLDLVFASQFSK